MTTVPSTGLQIRSLVKTNGELELSLAEFEVPKPADGEVLVRVEAAPINPSDQALLFADLNSLRATGAGLDTSRIKTFARRRRRSLRRERPQDLDFDRAGREPHPARRENRAARLGQAPDRRAYPLLQRARSLGDRGAPDPEDGTRGGGFEHAVHRRPEDPGGKPHRRGRRRLSGAPRRTESRAHPGGGRDGRPRAVRAQAGRRYARERIVFDRPIGANQGIQHPLAEAWIHLEAAWWLTVNAARR